MRKPRRKMIKLLQEETVHYRNKAGAIDFRDATTDQLKMLFKFNQSEYEAIKRIDQLKAEMKISGGINMIITGKEFRTKCRNNTFEGNMFPRESIERAVPAGWETADTHETVYVFSFKDSDRIVINNSLLRVAGWKKEGEI